MKQLFVLNIAHIIKASFYICLFLCSLMIVISGCTHTHTHTHTRHCHIVLLAMTTEKRINNCVM